MIRPSENLINYIKEKEGFSAEPYKDSTGKWTVGYGDTEGEMTTISETEAHRRLVDRLNITADTLNKNVTRKNFTQEQADVLFDMEYNIGITKLKDQGFIDLVNSGNDEQIGKSILNFNKARNPKTGELEIEKGLEARAGERASMWGYKKHLGPIGKLPDQKTDIYSEFSPKLVTENDYNGFAADDIYSNFKPAEVKPIDLTASRKVDLSLTGDAFDPAEAAKLKEARKFSNEQKIPFNEAEALIFDRSAEEAKIKLIEKDLARWFSTTSEWAKQMDNYAILKKSPESVTRIETTAKALNKDFLKALGSEIKNNKYQLEDSYIFTNALLGNMTPKQAAQAIEESEAASRSITPDSFKDDKGRISKKWMQLSKALGKTTESFGKAIEAASTEDGSVINELRRSFDGSLESSYRLWDAFKAMAQDPKATALITAQNLSSFAVSAGGAAAGGAVGFLTPVPGGAAAGAKYGSGIATGAYSFGLHAKELIQEKYTDPVTGKVLYEVAFSDPKFMSELRIRSGLYAGVMGLVDAKFTGMAGGKTEEAFKRIKELPTKNNFIKKSLLVSKEFGKGVLTQTLGEGVSETVASAASAAAGGELTAKKAGELVGKGAEEAALSLGTGIGIEGTGTAVRLFTRSPKESVNKTAETIKNSEESMASYNTLQALRSNLEDTNIKGNELEVEDLIDRVVIPKDDKISISSTIDETQIESAIEAEDKNLSEMEDQGYVNVYPSDWDFFHKEAGIDANEALLKLGDDIVEQYVQAKESDTSIRIPISKWITRTQENPEIDAIAYVNENKMNAVSGVQAVEALEKDPFMFFDETPEPPPLPSEDIQPIPDVIKSTDAEDFEPVSADQIDKMEMRPVGLYNRFRDEDSKRAFNKILGELKASTKNIERIDPKSLETLAEIQFRHTQSRAQILGVPVGDLADRLSFGKSKRAEAPDKNGQVTGGGFIPPQAVSLFRKIFFTKYATTKTLVHELGHSWIHEMTEDWFFINNIPDEKLTAQQREYKKAMEIASELFGLNTIDEFYKQPTEKISAMHEKFAQTTERYFFEGKFENSRIRQLLETFRTWMAKVAHMIGRSYPHFGMFEITPEVERMFDAILDANTKIEQELYPMFPEPMFPEGFLGRDAGKYLDLLSDVKSEAIGKLYHQMMKAPLREREAAINKALEVFNVEAQNIVDRLPSMKLLRTFKGYYEQYKKGQLESSPRISYESFKKLLANNDDVKAMQLKDQIPMEMVEGKKKGGVNIETVMQQLGITDPKAMLNLMLEANLRDELINDTVNEIIDKKLPLFKSDAEIHAEAVKAMNSKGKEKIILEEFKILSDRFKPQLRALIAKGVLPSSLLGTKDVKNTIEYAGMGLVLDAPITKFNYNRFLKNADKHGINAAANFKKGNILEAFDEKYKEAIHFSAYRQAIEIKRLLAETKVLVNNFSKLANDQTKANEYDNDLMRYGDVILKLFSNGTTVLPKLSLEGFADESGISPEHVDLINEKIDQLARLAKGRGGKDTSTLTYLTFGSILKTIKKFARDAKIVEIGGKEILRQNAVAQLIKEVGDKKPADVGFTEIESIQNMLLTLRPVRSELASLFPNDIEFEKSILGQIYADVTKAEALRNEKLDVARMRIIEAVKNAVKTEDKSIKELIRPVTNLVGSFILNTPPRPIRLENLNVTLDNKAELYMLMLEIGSDSGLEKILRGGVKGSGPLANYNMDTGAIDTTALQKDIDALIEAKELTKKDFDMFQVVWDQFEEFYPDLKKSIRRTDGRTIGYIQGRSITTPWGAYKGGYVPISSESYATQEALKSLRSPDNALFKSNELYPYMDMTNTQQRSGRFYDVSLDFSRITAKLAGVANIAYLREPLLNAGKILGSPAVNATIENRRPGFYDASLIPWFNRTKLQQFSEPSTEFIHKFSKMLRANMNLKFYFGNVVSALKQFLGVSNAIPLVGAGNITRASAKLALSPMATLRFIASKDLRMKQMFENHHINQIKSFERLDLNFDWLSQAKDKYITPWAFTLIKEAQNRTSAIVWLAGYDKAISEGLSEKQAINFAINAVKNSQGSTTISDMAQVQFGKDAWKLFTAFSIVPITGGAEIYKAYMRGGKGEAGMANVAARVGGALTIASFTVAVPTVINAIIADSLKSKEEDEEERLAKRKTPTQMRKEKNELLIKQMALDFVDQLVPVYGKMAARPLLYGDVSISPIIDNLAQDVTTAIKGKKIAEQGAEINAREFAAVMNLLTYGTGLPFTIIGKAEKMSEKSMPKSEKMAKAKKRRATLKRAKRLERNE